MKMERLQEKYSEVDESPHHRFHYAKDSVAGAFTRFLCDRVRETHFLEEVYYGGGDPVEKIEKLLRKSFSETEEDFRRAMTKRK